MQGAILAACVKKNKNANSILLRITCTTLKKKHTDLPFVRNNMQLG